MKKVILFLMIICLGLITSCTSASSYQKKYDLSQEVNIKEPISKEKMKVIIDEAINFVIDSGGYHTDGKVYKKNQSSPYSKWQDTLIFEKNGDEFIFKKGYIYKENDEEDGYIKERFIVDGKHWFYNHTTGYKKLWEENLNDDEMYLTFCDHSENDLIFILEGALDNECEYGTDQYGNILLKTYADSGHLKHEMRLVFKNNHLVFYAYAWFSEYNYLSYEYKNLSINLPSFDDYDKDPVYD